VLLKEMQSLALDVNVVSEEGQRAEMRDEDDDLLRAAEELGIDLSGVRAGDGAAADGEGPVAADEASTEVDADEAEEQEEAEESGEAPDTLEDVDLDADIDIGDIDIPEDDTEEAEA
jgi:DNA-directed RNA polymerase subunit beta